MPRSKDPLWRLWEHNDSHISKIIYREFELYAKDTGFYPVQRALFSLMTEGAWHPTTRVWQPARYTITKGSFEYWFQRLVQEGYIAIDPRTRAISSTGLEITERDNRADDLD